MDSLPLQSGLRRFTRRLLAVGLAAGAGWGLAAALLLLVNGAWLDLIFELPPGLRVAWAAGVLTCAALILAAAAVLTRRQSAAHALARRLDRAGGTGGQILSGVDLALEPGLPGSLTGGLAQLAVGRAARLAGAIPTARAVPARPAYRALAGAGVLAVLIVVAAALMPRLALAEWLRFSDPFGDHPPFSRVVYHVEPGDVQVVYGGGFDVRVTTDGPPVDRLDLVLLGPDAAAPEAVPLFPEPGGEWRATVANVTAPGRYHVRSTLGRSRQFQVAVLTMPRLEAVRFRVAPPAYTNLPAEEGPLPQGALAGLPGTEVRVWARSNRPLSGGSLQLAAREAAESVALAPAAPGEQEVSGSFTIRRPGKLQLRVTDTDGQTSTEAFTAPIAVLTDERPFVRMLEPPAQSFATPTGVLPVSLAAEDDYGVSRLQVFRSLNDSRALPLDVPLPARPPTRWSESLTLPLAGFGLEPGDEVKLYARVEDNDPAGPKGSESPVVVVRIISQEDFDRMVRARQGMEELLSKYQQARRRLEGVAAEADRLHKKLKDRPPDAEATKEEREGMKQLAAQMRGEAEALRRLSRNALPYDVDKELNRQLEQMARRLERRAQAADKLASESKLSAGAAAAALAEMLQEMNEGGKEFDREALNPLEWLATVYPLLEDAARFVVLYERQRDLANRLESLKGQTRRDDPALKTRMRDLQDEQLQIRHALGQLLDDIQDHIAKLPEEAELEELRKSAQEFFEAVRGSGAADAMADAEAGLAEFSGTRGHESAKKAADILEKFIDRVTGSGGMAAKGKRCLVFRPTLARCLGSTVEQLLAEAGLLPSSGGAFGQGAGAGGGYSARRDTLQNVGLYGSSMTAGESTAAGSSRDGGAGRQGGARTGSDRGKPTAADAAGPGRAAGAADAAVPPPYRRRVAEYFQRVADETGGVTEGKPQGKR